MRSLLLFRTAVAVAFIVAIAVWFYSDDGSLGEWIGFIGTLVLTVTLGATFGRRGVVFILAPTLMAIPLGTTNYDSGVPDALYVLTLGTPVLLVLFLLGMGARHVVRRVRPSTTG